MGPFCEEDKRTCEIAEKIQGKKYQVPGKGNHLLELLRAGKH